MAEIVKNYCVTNSDDTFILFILIFFHFIFHWYKLNLIMYTRNWIFISRIFFIHPFIYLSLKRNPVYKIASIHFIFLYEKSGNTKFSPIDFPDGQNKIFFIFLVVQFILWFDFEFFQKMVVWLWQQPTILNWKKHCSENNFWKHFFSLDNSMFCEWINSVKYRQTFLKCFKGILTLTLSDYD